MIEYDVFISAIIFLKVGDPPLSLCESFILWKVIHPRFYDTLE